MDGDYAQIQVGDVTLKVPVLIQPGQAKGSVDLAFGYGRKATIKKEMQVGVNAYVFYNNLNNVQPVSAAPSIAPSSAQQLSSLLPHDELQQGLVHL